MDKGLPYFLACIPRLIPMASQNETRVWCIAIRNFRAITKRQAQYRTEPKTVQYWRMPNMKILHSDFRWIFLRNKQPAASAPSAFLAGADAAGWILGWEVNAIHPHLPSWRTAKQTHALVSEYIHIKLPPHSDGINGSGGGGWHGKSFSRGIPWTIRVTTCSWKLQGFNSSPASTTKSILRW